MAASQAFKRGEHGGFHGEPVVGGASGRKAGFEADHVLARAILAEFAGDALLRAGEGQDRIEHLEPLEKFRETPAVGPDLGGPREWRGLARGQAAAEFVGQFGDGRDANRPGEMQVQIDLRERVIVEESGALP